MASALPSSAPPGVLRRVRQSRSVLVKALLIAALIRGLPIAGAAALLAAVLWHLLGGLAAPTPDFVGWAVVAAAFASVLLTLLARRARRLPTLLAAAVELDQSARTHSALASSMQLSPDAGPFERWAITVAAREAERGDLVLPRPPRVERATQRIGIGAALLAGAIGFTVALAPRDWSSLVTRVPDAVGFDQAEIAEARAEVEQARAELGDQAGDLGLDADEQFFEDIEAELDQGLRDPDEAVAAAAEKLEELAAQAETEADKAQDARDSIAERLAQMQPEDLRAARDLADALASGDFERAAQEAADLESRLDDPAVRDDLARLADQLERAADEPSPEPESSSPPMDELANELRDIAEQLREQAQSEPQPESASPQQTPDEPESQPDQPEQARETDPASPPSQQQDQQPKPDPPSPQDQQQPQQPQQPDQQPDQQQDRPQPEPGEQPTDDQQSAGEQPTESQPQPAEPKQGEPQPAEPGEPEPGETESDQPSPDQPQPDQPSPDQPDQPQPDPNADNPGGPNAPKPEGQPGPPRPGPNQPPPSTDDPAQPAPDQPGTTTPGDPDNPTPGGPPGEGPDSPRPSPGQPGSSNDPNALERLAQQQRRADDLRRFAKDLRERSDRLLGEEPDTPERNGPVSAPPPSNPWEGPSDLVDARSPQPGDDSRERVVGEWFRDPEGRPLDAAAPADASGVLRRAAEQAERAIEQQTVPRRHEDLIRRVFERYARRAAEAADASDAKDAAGD